MLDEIIDDASAAQRDAGNRDLIFPARTAAASRDDLTFGK
jgi:hypothetical protein